MRFAPRRERRSKVVTMSLAAVSAAAKNSSVIAANWDGLEGVDKRLLRRDIGRGSKVVLGVTV